MLWRWEVFSGSDPLLLLQHSKREAGGYEGGRGWMGKGSDPFMPLNLNGIPDTCHTLGCTAPVSYLPPFASNVGAIPAVPSGARLGWL